MPYYGLASQLRELPSAVEKPSTIACRIGPRCVVIALAMNTPRHEAAPKSWRPGSASSDQRKIPNEIAKGPTCDGWHEPGADTVRMPWRTPPQSSFRLPKHS